MRSGITSLDMSVLLDDTGVKEKEKKKLPSEKRDEEKDFVLFEEEEKEKEETKKLPSEKLDEDEFFVLFEEEDREDNQQSPGWGPAEDDDFINGLGIEERLPGQRVSNGALKIIGVEDEDLEQLEEIRKEGEKNREGIRRNFIRNIGNVFAKPNSHTTQMQANMFEGGTEGRTEERSPGQKVSDGALKIMGVDDEDLERLEEIRKEGEKKKTVVKEEPEQWKPTPEEWAEYSEYDIDAAEKELTEVEAKNSSNTVNIVSGGMNTKGSNFNTVNTDFSEMRANEERAAQLKFEIYIASLIQQVNEEYEIQNDPKKMALGRAAYNKWFNDNEKEMLIKQLEEKEVLEKLAVTGLTNGGQWYDEAAFAYKLYNDTSFKEPTNDWSEEQKNTWGWYIYNGECEKADRYAINLNNAINKQKKGEVLNISDQWAINNPLLFSLASIPLSFFGLLDAYTDGMQYAVHGEITELDIPTLYEISQSGRDVIENDIQDKIGGGSIYRAAMETADLLLASKLGKFPAIMIEYGNTMADSTDYALSLGASSEEAITYSYINAFVSTVLEKMDIDKLIEIQSKGLLNEFSDITLKELGGRTITGLSTYEASLLLEEILLKEKSQYENLVIQYQMMGFSPEEAISCAKAKINENIQKELLEEIISGTFTIGGKTVLSGIKKYNKK